MSAWLAYSIAGAIFLILLFIQILIRSKKPIRKTLGGIFTGIAALAIVNISGAFTGVTLPVSLLSLGIAGVSGIPGVTMMLILNIIAN